MHSGCVQSIMLAYDCVIVFVGVCGDRKVTGKHIDSKHNLGLLSITHRPYCLIKFTNLNWIEKEAEVDH